MNICADCAGLERREEMLGLGFDDNTITDQVQRRLLRGTTPAILCRTVLGLDDCIQSVLPRSR